MNDSSNDGTVRYGLEVVGKTIPSRSGGKKERPLQDRLDQIKGDVGYHKIWIAIADYSGSNVAGGAMRDMKKIYGGSASVFGWSFTTHRYIVVDGDGNEVRDSDGKKVRRCKLLVMYDPDKVDAIDQGRFVRNLQIVDGRKAAEKLGIDVEKVEREREGREGGGSGNG